MLINWLSNVTAWGAWGRVKYKMQPAGGFNSLASTPDALNVGDGLSAARTCTYA